MTLRQDIAKIIEDAQGDAEQAAIDVCRHLEREIGLNGNGWFDDDEEMQELLRRPRVKPVPK